MNDYWVYLLIADSVMLIYTIVRWVKFRRANRDVRLNFRLIELWAVTLSFSPALAVFGFLFRHNAMTEQKAPLILALLIPHQICAAILAVLRNHADPASARVATNQSTRDQFVYMFISSLFGILFPVFTLGIPFLILIMIAVWVFTLPFSLIPAAYIVNHYMKSRKRQPSVPPPRRASSTTESHL